MRGKVLRVFGLVLVIAVVSLVALFALRGRSSRRERDEGWLRGRMAECSPRPNCVSSRARGDQRVEPLATGGDLDGRFARIRAVLEGTSGVRIVTTEPDYLHAECRTVLFGFVDDLEVEVDREAAVIDVRSASRVGHSDMGANRKRVEAIRGQL